MTAGGVAQVITKWQAVLPAGVTRVGVEAAGHYHRPLAAPSVWPGWEVVELNPAHVAEQRRVMGRRRVKTDALDLEAMTELLLAGRGLVVTVPPVSVGGAHGWAAHRHRRVATRTATKNQLLGQLDRCFPGLTLVVPDVLGTKVGRLVAEHFADPHRLGGLGVSRFIRFAAARGLQVRLGRGAAGRRRPRRLTAGGCGGGGQVPAADLTLLADLDTQIQAAETRMAELVSTSLRSRRCCPCPAGQWCGSATTALRSATRPAGRATGSSTGPRGYRRPSTNRPVGAATGRSAGRAACSCAGR